jgi:integrase/recombinase XerD
MEIQVEKFLEYLNTQRSYSQSTRQAYASDLRRFLAYLYSKGIDNPSISDFTEEVAASFIANEAQIGSKFSTLYRRRASLRAFGRYLFDSGEMDAQLSLDNILPTRGKGDDSDVSTILGLEDLEVEHIKQVISNGTHPRALRDIAIFSLLIKTGLGIGALVSLDLPDVDLRAKRLCIRFGDDDLSWVPINDVCDVLSEYIFNGRPDLSPMKGEKALFISQMGRRMSRQGVWQSLRNWGRQANLSRELTPRLLRYTAAKSMVKANRSPEQMQKLLGHRNVLSTKALIRRLKSNHII